MLRFILGGSKTGKTSLIEEKILMLAKASELKTDVEANSKIMLIVPEQFSFEAEKTLFKVLGSELFKYVKVISFTRLSGEVFKLYGTLAGVYANECAKIIIMDRALEQIIDELEIYKKSALNKSFSKTMLDTITELKNAGISPAELSDSINGIKESVLKSKIKEIAIIYATYNAILLNTYLDPLDDLMRASMLLENSDYFDDCTIFIDEFKGFTADEKALIKIILKKSEDTYFSLCMDPVRANESSMSVFSSVNDTYNEINRIARGLAIKIAPPIILNNKNYLPNEIAHIEENIFHYPIKAYNHQCENVVAMLCKNEYDEVLYTASTIEMLIQEKGYSYNDIAVISRDLESYISQLESAFSNLSIPYFVDNPKSISNKPLIRFVQNLLDCITKGYTSENILGMLKCEMTDFSIEEISELENYLYVWNIKAKQWKSDFKLNPRGYSETTTDEDNEVLQRINNIRAFIYDCISSFKNAINDADGKDFCAAIVILLEKIKAKEKNEQLIEDFLKLENFEFAQEYERVWEILMQLLDTLAQTIASQKLSPKKFQDLFTLIVSTYDLGSLPQSLDCVILGSAERIRTTQKKAVFILGANENVFPLTQVSKGIFTDKDRKMLIDIDINISKPSVDKLKEERFIAYKALTSPSERLYITARKSDISGNAMSPSIVFSELERMFDEGIMGDTDDLNGEYFCRSKHTAFSYLAKIYSEDTVLRATLFELLSKDSFYAPKLAKLDAFYNKKEFKLENKENAVLLFGKDMKISPTRVEGFFQCHFRYFCEHGLRAFELRKAELNPLETGTLIHNILYIITKQLDLKYNYNEKTVKALIKTELDHYIDEVMGGVEDKTKRFIYLYNRMRQSIFKIVERLHFELLQSEFTPCGYEYEISENTDITPLKLYGENDTVINVAGKIDRVDRYITKKGEKYIRIIDYKSGKKEFKLNDVLYGLNLQMLIYLHCISQNGKGEFEGSLPAGILYMPAGEQTKMLDRNANDEEISKLKLESYKMNGLLIDDAEVLEAMETPMNGIFIPVSLKKDGTYANKSNDSLVSLTELAKINKYIDSLIIRMANELHNGDIEAIPIKESCDYCKYKSVCGKDKESKKQEYIKLDNEKIISTMQEMEV